MSASELPGAQLYGSRASCALGFDDFPDQEYSPIVPTIAIATGGIAAGPCSYYFRRATRFWYAFTCHGRSRRLGNIPT